MLAFLAQFINFNLKIKRSQNSSTKMSMYSRWKEQCPLIKYDVSSYTIFILKFITKNSLRFFIYKQLGFI